ncbi:MAG TPA: lipoyl(octanoyl) transferase LipB, partial [Gammaproteobacteria bacterium]|nr:lipoyl(octanoyl) transferase LipB [Gammaproteobacteria bacterium]
RDLGRRPLERAWADMRRFTEERGPSTPDEVWFLEHPPVFTLGLNGDSAHVLAPGTIPVVQIDRGGQVTYHGPGQLVVYVLLDVKRRGLSIRGLVEALENAVIRTIADYGVEAYSRREAPGVYVEGRKLAAIGLRIRRNGSYHGIAINVDMDLSPFRAIHPCGYADLEVTQLADLCGVRDLARLRHDLEPRLREALEEASPAQRHAAPRLAR